ncbi:hypothetical protein [Paenibacillus chitinolyticus]|uniref:hypothetical protein n=1 Tax=Paenibacillus chitinolyticus TaxID=79263 RepID=UPI001C489564|nr:hypothetical protein [Paenibacillus chitinolyticus]MBV6716566.1 hypothetical protein [Paenibacillus chitinolyticus]
MGSIEEIWNLVDQLHGRGERITLQDLIREVKSQGLFLSVDVLAELAWRTERSEILVPPPLVRKTISALLKHKIYRKVLDPWDRLGGLIQLVSPESTRLSILYNSFYQELFSVVEGNTDISFVMGNPLEFLSKNDSHWDLIVSCPPFAMRRDKIILQAGDSIETVSDSMELLLLLQACTRLSAEGTALFVVASRFFGSNSFRHLSSIGIHLEAIVHFPPGTFAPYTDISTYLIVLRQIDVPKMTFLAEIGSEDDIQPVIRNMTSSKQGRILEHGTFVDPHSFRSFKAIQLAFDINQLSRRMNLEPIPLTSIIKEINQSNIKLEEGFEDLPDALYLPIVGKSDAVTHLSDIRLKPRNYVQIVMKSEKTSAEYMARFFSSELGRLIRDYLLRGGTIPLSSLKESEVYLPSVETQIKMINAQNEITELRAMLHTIEQQLWKKPNDVDNTLKSLKNINRETGFGVWVETLPFPLASILWRYDAESDVRMKKEHLFHFFEAMAQFNTMLLLSGLKSDSSLLVSQRETVFANFNKESLYRSTFGTWIVLGERIAKLIRTQMGNRAEGSRESCLKAFRSSRPDLIDTLSSKKTFEVLKRTADFRNKWKGHGGIENGQEAQKRLSALETELAVLRQLMIDTYEGYQIIRPENGVLKSGIYHMQVSSLMGTRQIFKKISIQTTLMPDSDKLYLYFEGNPEPLELLPFIKFKSGPSSEENACYFYNSVEKSGVRWVSYHFDKEAEFLEADAVLEQTLKSLI